jgi:transcriptional regulator GlxA family with amidase domain
LSQDDTISSRQAPHSAPAQALGFLLIPDFSLMSYASAMEPFRSANRMAGRPLYSWRHVSIDGRPVVASNGVAIAADCSISDAADFDILFVCAGGNPSLFDHQPTYQWLRRLAHRKVRLGGVSGGSYPLARAGLLDGYRCTIHWEHIPAFVEEFPALQVARTLYEIDRDRLTCAGGIAALDMMHELIERDHGSWLAAAVSDQFLHSQVRVGSGPQRMTVRERYGVSHPKLLKVLEYMEGHVEDPLGRSELAAIAGISTRQLERLFHSHLKITVGEHYLGVRLERAQTLLRQTTMPVLEISIACGFVSASHFSRSYKQLFGHSPKAERADAELSVGVRQNTAAARQKRVGPKQFGGGLRRNARVGQRRRVR